MIVRAVLDNDQLPQHLRELLNLVLGMETQMLHLNEAYPELNIVGYMADFEDDFAVVLRWSQDDYLADLVDDRNEMLDRSGLGSTICFIHAFDLQIQDAEADFSLEQGMACMTDIFRLIAMAEA